MLLLAILCILVGAVLGLRFKVFVLVPAIALAWLLFLLFGMDIGASLWSSAISMVVIAASAQFGYLCGISTRMMLGMARLARRGRNWQPMAPRSEGSIG